jgi:hypothetical protein
MPTVKQKEKQNPHMTTQMVMADSGGNHQQALKLLSEHLKKD